MAKNVDVRMDGQAVARMLNSKNGPAMRHTAEVAERVKDGARRQVGVSDPAQRSTSRGQAQHLRDAIVKRFVSDSKGNAVHVGSDLAHARVHHEGSKPHVIRPVSAQFLRFKASDGRVVFTKRVNHPGTRPNRYLVDQARRLGLKVRKLS